MGGGDKTIAGGVERALPEVALGFLLFAYYLGAVADAQHLPAAANVTGPQKQSSSLSNTHAHTPVLDHPSYLPQPSHETTWTELFLHQLSASCSWNNAQLSKNPSIICRTLDDGWLES